MSFSGLTRESNPLTPLDSRLRGNDGMGVWIPAGVYPYFNGAGMTISEKILKVIPAEAGIQSVLLYLDPDFRRDGC
jgi:hypothetical protein